MSGRGGPPLPKRKDGDKIERFGGGGWEGHGDYMREKEAKLQQQQQAVELVSEALKGCGVPDGITTSGLQHHPICGLTRRTILPIHHGEVVTHFVVNRCIPARSSR